MHILAIFINFTSERECKMIEERELKIFLKKVSAIAKVAGEREL